MAEDLQKNHSEHLANFQFIEKVLIEEGYVGWRISYDENTLTWEDPEGKPSMSSLWAKAEEKAKNYPMEKLRRARDKRLSETDWVVSKYTELGQPIPDQWKEYRQSLRDITTSYNSLRDVVWPTKPN